MITITITITIIIVLIIIILIIIKDNYIFWAAPKSFSRTNRQMLPLLQRNVDECFGATASRRGKCGPTDTAPTVG
jgi:hypothetical protein